MKITTPGIYNLPEHEYHADPVEGGSLSSSGAKLLLPPSAPAIFHHRKSQPNEPTDDMIFGSAAHKEVLGVGADIVLVEAGSWRTNDAKEQRAEALAAGRIPLLAKDYDTVLAMAAAVRRHRWAAELLEAGSGVAEQTMIWQTGDVWRRALVDWIRTDGRLVDYKTTYRSDQASVNKSIATYGYHQQGDWYVNGAQALGLTKVSSFRFVFQEKTPPYLVTVVRLSDDDMAVGARANVKAIDIYRQCRDTDIWPGHVSDERELDSRLPGWVDRHDEDNSRAQYIN